MNVNKIQYEKTWQITAKVTMELWSTTMLQSSFYWLLTFYCLFIFYTIPINKRILFIFKYLFNNNIKNLKWSSKLKNKRKRMRFEVIVSCKVSVLHNYWKTFSEIHIWAHLCRQECNWKRLYSAKNKKKQQKKQESLICLIKDYLLWN